MTGFTGRKNHGRGHSYWIDGVRVAGVTSIISGGLPKPALVNWASRTAAEYAVDEWDTLAELPPSERLKLITGAPNANRDAAAIRGTRVHALAEPLANGEEVTVPDELAGHVEACLNFLEDFDVHPIISEASIISRRWKYGGTLDLIASLGDGKRWLLDWKTNKSGPFGDVAFQLAAYRHADMILDPEGGERPMMPVDECGVVWLRADGYDLYPFHADQGVFRQFLYIQQTAKAASDARDYKGDAIMPPVRSTK